MTALYQKRLFLTTENRDLPVMEPAKTRLAHGHCPLFSAKYKLVNDYTLFSGTIFPGQ